jgi:hypothetical protein
MIAVTHIIHTFALAESSFLNLTKDRVTKAFIISLWIRFNIN